MTSDAVTGGNDYHSIEIVTVRQPDGRWRVFPTLMETPEWPMPLGCTDYFDLPTFADQELAETMGVFLAWRYLDAIRVWDPALQAYRPVNSLE